MNRIELIAAIKSKKSVLCVGLDTDQDLLPSHLKNDPDGVLKFNKAIIDACADYAVAFKINTAFYEWMGPKGWEIIQETLNYIPKNIFSIADAKRGDIGNTSDRYARTFFKTMNFDSVTVAPYMGSDSVKPFLNYPDKFTILLALTSNEGGKDFQLIESNGIPLYQEVLKTSSQWGTIDNMMYVVGATRADYLQQIRKIVPEHFLLVPGVGAQGGSLDEVMQYGANADYSLLINSSRAIIYASSAEDFAEKAREEAQKTQKQMEKFF